MTIETGGWTGTYSLVSLALGILPVFVFLVLLVYLDSYKLVRFAHILRTILLGCAVALLCIGINRAGFELEGSRRQLYAAFGAPVTEEGLKALYIYWLIRTGRIGFMVDGAIYGFAIGAGFALVENLYYLGLFGGSNLLVWILRGFGTAVMHGGATAIVGILAIGSSSLSGFRLRSFAPGLAIAIVVHSFYNLSLLNPLFSTVVILVALPSIMAFTFMRSERSLHKWLMEGFDADIEMLETISRGRLSETHAGKYLESLKKSFAPEVVADMFCLMQVSLELAVRAKGDLLKREAGFDSPPDPEVKSKFEELGYLEKSIGRTGKLALSPLLANSARDVWQLRLLGYK
jgi:RsiW-degrading membrane proteinase PrsW (M82 family)